MNLPIAPGGRVSFTKKGIFNTRRDSFPFCTENNELFSCVCSTPPQKDDVTTTPSPQAGEYHNQMKEIENILKAKKWQHYLTRPLNLLGASLWHAWYDSEECEDIFGIRLSDVLFLEEKKDVARCYRQKEQVSEFNQAAREIYLNTPKIRALLEKAEQLNAQAVQILKGKEKIKDFKEAIHFLIALSLHATTLPYRAGEFLNEIKDKEIIEKTKELRAISYYPRIIEEIIIPLAKEKARKAGVKDFDKIGERLTCKEIAAGQWEKYAERKDAEGGYVYAVVNGKEYIFFTKEIDRYIQILEPIINSIEIKGMCVYPGRVQGKVRIVNERTIKGVVFNKREILVSVSTSPIYMPLIQKAAAIVTDEGGLVCHAAILSRELKKPCVIGTKNATRMLKDGDLVEVDAEKGIVRILKKDSW